MNKKEINETIATGLFGLVPQVDFGKWEQHEWERLDTGEVDNFAFEREYCNGPCCTRCGDSHCIHCGYEEGVCEVSVPDYTTKAGFWVLLDKLKESFVVSLEVDDVSAECTLQQEYPEDEGRFIWSFVVEAEDMPMAVCLAAVRLINEKLT